MSRGGEAKASWRTRVENLDGRVSTYACLSPETHSQPGGEPQVGWPSANVSQVSERQKQAPSAIASAGSRYSAATTDSCQAHCFQQQQQQPLNMVSEVEPYGRGGFGVPFDSFSTNGYAPHAYRDWEFPHYGQTQPPPQPPPQHAAAALEDMVYPSAAARKEAREHYDMVALPPPPQPHASQFAYGQGYAAAAAAATTDKGAGAAGADYGHYQSGFLYYDSRENYESAGYADEHAGYYAAAAAAAAAQHHGGYHYGSGAGDPRADYYDASNESGVYHHHHHRDGGTSLSAAAAAAAAVAATRPSPQFEQSPASSPGSQKYCGLYSQGGAALTSGSPTSPRSGNENAVGGGASSLLCAVCGDNAACQHYGVRTCEGCKGFFKRTVQKKAKYVCLADKKCPVDKRRRNRCQFCRFQKCLAVGMVKEVVRTDSLKGRRGRLPTKPKNPNDSPPSPPVPLIVTLVKTYMESACDIPYLGFMSSFSNDKENVRCLMDVLQQTTHVLLLWLSRIHAFSEVSQEDRETLAESRCFDFFFVSLAQRIKSAEDTITVSNGTVYHRAHLQGLAGELLSIAADFSLSLEMADIDINAHACMLILAVLTQRAGIQQLEKVESAEGKIIDTLRDHCTYNPEAQQKPHLYSRTLAMMPELRKISQRVLHKLHKALLDCGLPVPHKLVKLFRFSHGPAAAAAAAVDGGADMS